MRYATALIPSLFFALALPTAAKDSIIGTYEITGSHSRQGPFTGDVRVEDGDDGLDLVVHARYPSGSAELLRGKLWKDGASNPAHASDGQRIGDELRVRATCRTSIVGAIGGGNASTDVVLVFRLTDPTKGEAQLQATWEDGSRLDATGKREGEWKDLAGRLLVYSPEGLQADAKRLLGKELKKALASGIDVSERLELHDYMHVGIGTEVAWIPDAELNRIQLDTVLAQPHKVWIESSIEGGLRLPFGTSLPIGSAASVSLGLQPGVELEYRVVELHDKPAGITDVETIAEGIESIAKRVVDLPLQASEAEAMPPGAERTIDGVLTVALSGSLGVGHDTKELGDHLEVGASARVGGFYRIRRSLRLRVARLEGREVRVRLDTGEGTRIRAEARALLGAALDEDEAVEEIAPSVEYIEPVVELGADQVNKVVKKALRFQLQGAIGRDRSSGVDVCFKVDLADGAARLAYERAVRGDFTVLDRLAAQGGQGVEQEFRVLDFENHAFGKADLRISLLAEGKLSKDVTDQVLQVTDHGAVTHYEVFRFQRRRALGLAKLIKKLKKEWDESLQVETIRAKPQDGAAAAALSLPHWIPARRSLTLRYDLHDPFTRKEEMERLRRTVTAWGFGDVNGIPTPGKPKFLETRWGKTEAHLLLEVSEAGVYVLLQKRTDDEVLAAFLNAYATVHGEEIGSDEARKKAAEFLANVRGLANAPDAKTRAAHLRQLCEGAGWDLSMATAVRALVPQSTQRVQIAIDGKRIDFDGERTGRKHVPFVPVLPGSGPGQ